MGLEALLPKKFNPKSILSAYKAPPYSKCKGSTNNKKKILKHVQRLFWNVHKFSYLSTHDVLRMWKNLKFVSNDMKILIHMWKRFLFFYLEFRDYHWMFQFVPKR